MTALPRYRSSHIMATYGAHHNTCQFVAGTRGLVGTSDAIRRQLLVLEQRNVIQKQTGFIDGEYTRVTPCTLGVKGVEGER